MLSGKRYADTLRNSKSKDFSKRGNSEAQGTYYSKEYKEILEALTDSSEG